MVTISSCAIFPNLKWPHGDIICAAVAHIQVVILVPANAFLLKIILPDFQKLYNSLHHFAFIQPKLPSKKAAIQLSFYTAPLNRVARLLMQVGVPQF